MAAAVAGAGATFGWVEGLGGGRPIDAAGAGTTKLTAGWDLGDAPHRRRGALISGKHRRQPNTPEISAARASMSGKPSASGSFDDMSSVPATQPIDALLHSRDGTSSPSPAPDGSARLSGGSSADCCPAVFRYDRRCRYVSRRVENARHT